MLGNLRGNGSVGLLNCTFKYSYQQHIAVEPRTLIDSLLRLLSNGSEHLDFPKSGICSLVMDTLARLFADWEALCDPPRDLGMVCIEESVDFCIFAGECWGLGFSDCT